MSTNSPSPLEVPTVATATTPRLHPSRRRRRRVLTALGGSAVVALAAYTLVRQAILGLRDEPRHWRYGRAVTATLAALALMAGVVLLAVA